MKSKSDEIFDQRMQHLDFFINHTVQKLISEKLSTHLRQKRVNATLISSKLKEALNVSLRCEREEYLRLVTDKLEQAIAERNKLELEYKKLESKLISENSVLEDQHLELLQKYNNLAKKYKTLQFQQTLNEESKKQSTRKEEVYSPNKSSGSMIKNEANISSLVSPIKNENEKLIHDMKQMLIQSQTEIKSLSENLKDVKSTTLSNLKRQQNVIHNASKYLQKEFGSQMSALRLSYESRIDETTKTEYLSLRNSVSQLLDVLREINPKIFPNITPDNFTLENAQQISIFLSEAIESARNDTKKTIENEIKSSFPEVASSNGSVIEMIEEISKRKLEHQEKIFGKQLRKLQKKERHLRERLEASVADYQKATKAVRAPKSNIDDDVELMKASWKRHMSSIDMKLSDLGQISKY